MAGKKNTRGSAEPEATAEATPGASVVSGLDKIVRELSEKVEAKVNKVGGDIARNHGLKAVALLNEAVEELYQAEREDR